MNLDPTKERKKLLVEKPLWECVQALWEAVQQIEHEFKGEADFVGRCLVGFKDMGCATSEWDTDGNLIYTSTAKLLSLTGQKSGPLELCATFRKAPAHAL
jgi:hypothetical protein